MANKFSIQSVGKHVCGSYFNMALTNYFRTINDVFIKCEIKFRLSENKNNFDSLSRIINASSDMSKAERQICNEINDAVKSLRLKKMLYKRFPLLGPVMDNETYFQKNKGNSELTDASLKDCLKTLSTIGRCLVHCRNYYTHFHPYNSPEDLQKQYRIQGRVARFMVLIFDVSRRLEQRRDGLTANEMEFLTGKGKRYKIVGKKFTEREDWYFKLTQEKDGIKVLSDFGVVYFCSLFLAKNYAYRLFDEAKLFDNSPLKNDENAFVREMLTIYRIRMPRGKQLDSHDGLMALAMDMLNELRKCPGPLYPLLSDNDKKQFHAEVKNQNDKTEDFFKLLRATDRFPYLALRYIDEKELFKRIRFQIRLGSYRFKFYDKVNIDGTTRVRNLQKEINGFGRLQDMETERRLKWEKIFQKTEQVDFEDMYGDLQSGVTQFVENTAQTEPYVTNVRATFNIHNNRIGMYWNDGAEGALGKNKMFFPELKNDNEGKADVYQPAPKASISIYDLPALVFYTYLYNKMQHPEDFESAETLIIKKYDSLISFFKDVADSKVSPYESKEAFGDSLRAKYGLMVSEVPEKLSKWLAGLSCDSQPSDEYARKLADEVSKRRQRAEKRLERFNNDVRTIGCEGSTPYGKKGHVKILHSQLAIYLMRSVMEWQPSKEEGRNKLTGQNYHVMVASLATFIHHSQFEGIKDMFARANMLGGHSAHPFLKDVLSNTAISNIQDLYRCYLVKEITFLQKRELSLMKAKNIKDVVRQLPFARFNRKRYQDRDEVYYRHLAKRYLYVDGVEGKDAVVMLPDGMFTPHIYCLMKKMFAGNQKIDIMLDDDVARNNAAFLISAYMEIGENDFSQPYYKNKRSYELFNILQDTKVRNVLQPRFIAPKEISGLLTEKNDKGKVIIQQIDDHSKHITKKGNYDSLQEAQEAMARKLKHLISDCKDTERAIRRYKTQDTILFIMAREILKGIVPDYHDKYADDRNFCLEKACEDGFLSQAVNMEYEMPVDGTNRKVKIIQPNMSLKNYGEFHRLLNDERLQSLLLKLSHVDEIDYASLTGEFAVYDQKRSEVFRIVQEIEQLIFEANREELIQEDSPLFFDISGKHPRLNNFRSMLELLDGSSLDERQRDLIVLIRNAFGHNTYKIDLEQIDATELPNIARKILEKMNELRNQI